MGVERRPRVGDRGDGRDLAGRADRLRDETKRARLVVDMENAQTLRSAARDRAVEHGGEVRHVNGLVEPVEHVKRAKRMSSGPLPALAKMTTIGVLWYCGSLRRS